jgi:predicted O-methyltransferase YrrM
MLIRTLTFILAIVFSLPIVKHDAILSQESTDIKSLDVKVKAFLENQRGQWHDMNVPESDGKLLYDLIIENDYKEALEIGTSTGHSTIWIAWALSKTGGKLITIEIDEDRYRIARENIKEAGLSDYVDARLADAHILVKELEGPFDFIFSDADKHWYTQYFKDLYPKLEIDGCFTAHNISGSAWGNIFKSGTTKFYEYIKSLEDMETTLNESGNGLSISFKRALDK